MPEPTFHKDYAFLSREELLTYEEIERMGRAFASLGVEKVRLTGGEPLLRRDLCTLISMLRNIPKLKDLALTTNGLLLRKHADALKQAGLNRLTVSLDGLDDTLLSRISGRPIQAEQILDGIQAAQDAGFETIKINMMVQRGVNDHEIERVIDHFQHTPHEVRLIEFMDVGNTNDWNPEKVVPSNTIRENLAAKYSIQSQERARKSDVSSSYLLMRPDTPPQKLGFISSISKPFCGECSRARLSAIGEVFTCLFANSGTSIRQQLRAGATEDQLARTLEQIWSVRTDQYSMTRLQSSKEPVQKVEMSYIGG